MEGVPEPPPPIEDLFETLGRNREPRDDWRPVRTAGHADRRRPITIIYRGRTYRDIGMLMRIQVTGEWVVLDHWMSRRVREIGPEVPIVAVLYEACRLLNEDGRARTYTAAAKDFLPEDEPSARVAAAP